MRKLLMSLILLTMAVSQAAAQEQAALVAEARMLTQQFSKRLQAELSQALEQGGPGQALGVCQAQAPLIAEEVSAASGWQVGRTALRLRNQANGPDAWEEAGLRQMLDSISKGSPVEGLHLAEVVQDGKGKVFRYLEAIPTRKICLDCHGLRVNMNVKGRLWNLYPGDQATGFHEGELRGAFSLKRRLP